MMLAIGTRNNDAVIAENDNDDASLSIADLERAPSGASSDVDKPEPSSHYVKHDGGDYAGSPGVGGGANEEAALLQRPVQYRSENHAEVLFQMYGSVWKEVLPFCIFNSLFTIGIFYLQKYSGYDLSLSDRGHTSMGVLGAFLIVSRVQYSVSRIRAANEYLVRMCRSGRDLIQMTAVMSKTDMSEKAKKWRSDVAYHTCLLLRVTSAMLEFTSSGKVSWDIPEIEPKERNARRMLSRQESQNFSHNPIQLNMDGSMNSFPEDDGPRGYVTEAHESQRFPLRVAYQLRDKITDHPKALEEPLSTDKEIKLLELTELFVQVYHDLRSFIDCPFPFPLAQMTRTFLFFYIFSLPFVLLNDGDKLVQDVFIVFITTYGFVGLEYVSIELDDPFGDDPNDFDHVNMAYMAIADIYLTIYDVDGMRSANDLRGRLKNQINPRRRSSMMATKRPSLLTTATGSFEKMRNKARQTQVNFTMA